ncbi:GDP/GTP exchange factor Sec2p [Drepanopeziza brunnea f. sp. 'multigermtubi' MB_m1]|uniref:GDP/GTP exchange factor Sec2p n=1 Tax=Marssonina brunnea f. sp. multigermtubi (strain MB_m1) TaxID=1072389 RepID=K1WV62_MARBU|nr:GDP/GTP exchange factor Sec2p [Drepanopeziza brunnea f. sp. 'multigermtubi' MB_m1]EKD21530.1 GDP/GTP exchange factor Sec2p [Drepanopeziza brunnea f. sp. 'multigermtubi' MB_m1]
MSEFVQMAAYAGHNHPISQPSLQHLRSCSSNPAVNNAVAPHRPNRPVSKSISASALRTMASFSSAPGIPSRVLSPFSDEEGNMTTLPDPRSRASSHSLGSGVPNQSQHPDLSNEVAMLSNKLIHAINHQTSIDDELSATRHELESFRERVMQLERENREDAASRAREASVQASAHSSEKAMLEAALAEEKRQKAQVEKEKKQIEHELENLTTALFEEANRMVITAREEAQRDHEIVQRKNDQLKAKLADTESLLKSHQDQLAELKQVMEHLTEDRDDQTNQTAPSTPALSRFDSKDLGTPETEAPQSSYDPISPSYPMSFTHLLQPVLRTDLSAYEDFISLLRMSKNVPAASRVSSGSYGSIGLGLGLGSYTTSQQPTNGSSTSLSTTGPSGSSPATPTTPASTASNASYNGPNSLTPLKDTKFYKRAQAEDIEPTLRLDSAPGLSWLARRTVLSAVCEGSLVVEPMPSSTKPYAFACSLCGETRKDPAHVRSHRFRASENDNAQRYPLCRYCLGRVRSTCDFLGFLRILKEGHWRADDEESERAAWEESVRLREQMFWCRVGGGVVPTSQNHLDTMKSPRLSQERREQERKVSEELERTGEIQPKDITPVDVTKSRPSSKAFAKDDQAEEPREVDPQETAAQKSAELSDGNPVTEVAVEGVQALNVVEKRISASNSTQSTKSLGATPPGERLSITIPGAFE